MRPRARWRDLSEWILVADTAEGKARKTKYVDNGWPTTDPDDHAVSELVTDRTGALVTLR